MSDNLKEIDNFQRFIVLFIDVGTELLLKVFDYIDKQIFPISKKSPIAQEIQNKFPKKQYYTILAAKSPAEFDIGTLLKLLCEVFSHRIPPSLIPNIGRLRSIRNTVVARSTTARLSDADFDKNVEDFEICLKRIIHEVDPGSEHTLANTIEEFTKQTIDATKAREYCQSNAIKIPIDAPTPFLRYVELLLFGGNFVLLEYLRKLLEKSGVSLERLLRDNHALMLRELPEWMTQQLYSESEEQIQVNTDTHSWDISLLTRVIETIFGNEVGELVLEAIRLIRNAREDNAMAAHYTINNDDRFSHKREDLMGSLTTIAWNTGEESVKKLKIFIEKNRSSSEVSADSNEYFAKLKSHGSGIKSIGDLYKETEQNLMLQQDDRNIPDAFENDPYYLQLYNDAISKGEENDRVIRVNVVGNFAQGKTTLIKRLTHQPIEGVESTNSIEISHCEYECTEDKLHFNTKEHVDNEDHFTLRVARVAVKRKEQNLRNLPQHSSLIPSVLEMKTDIENDRKTEEKNSKHQFEVKTEETIERTGTVDRNLDSPKRRREQIREETSYVSKKFALHVQNSRHKYTHQNNLEIWDFGGQFSYYATHTLFHSRRAVYLLVFDLSIPLKKMVIDSDFPNRQDEKTMEEYAQFWLNSIDAYVGSEDGKEPPVILVGTHKDKLKGDEVVKDEEIYTYFAQIMRLFNNTTNMKCHIQPRFFSVDNNDENDHDVIELRKEVIKQGEKLANTSIPAIWIPLEKALQMKRHTKIMSFEDMMIIGNEVQLKDEEEVKLFLRYHHFKGTLLYFDEEPISAYVVLDPQYLIDAFKCIITTKRFSAQDLLDTLYEEALLENALIDCLWNNENGFSSHKKELLMFLEKHLIISEVPVFDEKCQKSHGSGKYLVPSLLPSSSTEAHLIAFLESGNQTSVRFVMSFYRSAVVQLVFYRLLAAMTGKWKIFQKPISRKPTIHKTFIYENKGVFQLDTYHAGIVEYTENEIDLRVLRLDLSDDVERKCADKFRRFSELIVKNEFMKFRNSVALNSKPYKVCLRCNDKMHGSEGSISAVPLANLGDKDMRCPDLHTHVIRPAQVLSEWFLKDEEDIDEDKSFLDRQIDDRELSEISKAIGKNWEVLGLNLGLTKVKLDHIQMDEGTAEMRIYAMLQEWKGHNKDCATIKALIHAMKNDTRVRIDWEHMRNFIDKIKSTSN